jgi:hypothetical protein
MTRRRGFLRPEAASLAFERLAARAPGAAKPRRIGFLGINCTTAHAVGTTVPLSPLVRAHLVIL